jgi:hypothetical protein
VFPGFEHIYITYKACWRGFVAIYSGGCAPSNARRFLSGESPGVTKPSQ